jgi:hypothetical protein
LGVIACSTTKELPETSDACSSVSCPFPVAPNTLIQQENWQLTLPGVGWSPIKSPDKSIKVIFENMDANDTVVFFNKEETLETPVVYTIRAMRSFAAAHTSTQQVIIHDKVFVLVTAHGTKYSVWSWINVSQGAGYIFSCRAIDYREDAGLTPFQRCNEIAQTVIIQ